MEIGWTELLVIGIVALIVIGPKDLPAMFRELGRFTAKMQKMGREFSRAMEAAAKETGVNDIAADLKGVTSARSLGLEAVKGAADKFEKWDPLKNAAKPTNPAAVGARSVGPSAAVAAAAAAPVAETAPVAAAVPLAEAAPASVTEPGPETRALAEKVAARKAIADEAAARLRALNAAPAPVAVPDTPAETVVAKAKPKRKAEPVADAAPKVKRGGRTRKAARPDGEPGETA